MGFQINGIEDIIIKKCESGNYLAWPVDREDIIANGETEQEVVDNLMVMAEEVSQYEYKCRLFTQRIGDHLNDHGIDGLAECILAAIEARPKDELSTVWYLYQLVSSFKKQNTEFRHHYIFR